MKAQNLPLTLQYISYSCVLKNVTFYWCTYYDFILHSINKKHGENSSCKAQVQLFCVTHELGNIRVCSRIQFT
jgi:hypothetical protein